VTNPEERPQRYVKLAMVACVFRKMPDLTTEAYSSFSTVDEAMEHDLEAMGEDPQAFLDDVFSNPNGKTEFYYVEAGFGELPNPTALEGGGGE
jgi:hypothetical protein